MEKITSSNIVSNEEYLECRETKRKEIIALKNKRRIELGPRISLTFENRETVVYQIQEMMRVENITDPEKIQLEIDVYNDLIPDQNCLSATLFIEITDANQVKEVLDKMQGLEAPDVLYLSVDSEVIPAEFEAGHSKEGRISAVQYVRFALLPNQISTFAESQVEIHVNHPQYKASTLLTGEQKKELAKDLAG